MDSDAIKYAKDVLNLTDESLLNGRMSDKLIETINEVKLKHRTSNSSTFMRWLIIKYFKFIGFSLNKWHKDDYYKK